MTACAAPPVPLSPPPSPLSSELRADLAYRRARGDSWEELGAAFRFDADALRRAAAADPLFAAELDTAWAEATWEAEAAAMNRLRKLAASEDQKVALRAAEALVRCVGARRRAEAQRAKAAKRTARVDPPRALESPSAPRRADAVAEVRPPRQVVMG